ncbi:MAG TPA: histidine kinase dimerization/phosphoacceptor domain -containing protein [Spirochaetota bacterium]|nr:histidine kinase dimerization/phosphoacceptor domain -containing protein [Spirochaetota bacterium]HOM38266.1 histidine kinase dimerization/phosphoacceptor domain -containing protein [Spirochaetota bacterium]HPQ48516.1 histidine kinase dimerization/phosphoacceptor domain -containing protein [Spirochaetota bacterium]
MPIKISLKRLLLVNLIVVSILPLLILYTFSNGWVKKDLTEEVKIKNTTIASILANDVKTFFNFFVDILNSLTERTNDNDIQNYIIKVQKDIKNLSQIFITNKEGNIINIAPYETDFIGLDISKKDYFFNANENREYFSNVDLNIFTDEPSVYISKKTKNKNRTIIIKINVNEIKKIFCNKDIKYFITDKNNTILFSTEPEEAMQRINVSWLRKKITETYTSEVVFKNKEYILTYIPFNDINWGFSVLYEKDKALLPVQKISNSMFVILLIVIIFSILTSSLIARKILKPIEHIRQKIKYISNGNYTTEIESNGIIELNGTIYDVKSMAEIIKNREEELKYLKEKYEKIVNTVPVSVMMIDKDGKILEWNNYSEKLFGWRKEEVIRKKSPIIPEELEEETENMRKSLMKGQSIINYETIRNTKWGEKKYLIGSASPITIGDEKNIVVAYVDVTEKKELEKRLKESLDESNSLLREIHHRIKNNLQIISGLLYLQSIFIEDKIALAALSESQKRIKTMITIHEMLYKTRRLSHVDLDIYIEHLVKTIFEDFLTEEYNIKYSLNLEKININADKASNCGLIINEVINNSIKHAFPKKKGKIEITLKKVNNNVILKITDNGKGFDKENISKKGIGLELINSLVNGLRGKLTINSGKEKGTEFIIGFSLSDENFQ